MNTSHLRRLLLAGLGALLALIAAAPSLAAPPTFTVIPVDNTFEFPYVSDACGFPVVFHEEGRVKIAEHVDRSGSLTQVIITSIQWKIAFTNPATGASIESASPLPVKITFEPDGTELVARLGLNFALTVPGQGLISLETGKIVLDQAGAIRFEAGPHPFIRGDLAPLCDALAVR